MNSTFGAAPGMSASGVGSSTDGPGRFGEKHRKLESEPTQPVRARGAPPRAPAGKLEGKALQKWATDAVPTFTVRQGGRWGPSYLSAPHQTCLRAPHAPPSGTPLYLALQSSAASL